MGSFLERNLVQKAVYWGSPRSDGYGGFTWDPPIEIRCRWVDSTKVVLADKGKEVISTAQVHVKQDVDKEGMLLLGSLDDLDSSYYNDPYGAGARAIIRFDKTPDIKGRYFFREAYL